MSVEIMVNTCYGGFGLSEAAMDEYRKRCPGNENVDYYDIDRHDPVMVQILKQMGEAAFGAFSRIKLKKIPVQYLDHYSISEYDGLEHVVIHYNSYKIDTAKAILRDRHLNKTEKLLRVSAVLNAELRGDTYVNELAGAMEGSLVST